MKKLLNVLSIVANIAIITGLITDTWYRIGAAKRKNDAPTSLDEDDKIWETGGTDHYRPRRNNFYAKKWAQIQGYTEKKD